MMIELQKSKSSSEARLRTLQELKQIKSKTKDQNFESLIIL